jgi:hypothetical protein
VQVLELVFVDEGVYVSFPLNNRIASSANPTAPPSTAMDQSASVLPDRQRTSAKLANRSAPAVPVPEPGTCSHSGFWRLYPRAAFPTSHKDSAFPLGDERYATTSNLIKSRKEILKWANITAGS